MDTKTQVRNIIIDLLKVRPEELKEGQTLEQSLGVDSTEMVEVCIALQKAFNVKIEEKEVAKTHTLDQIASVVDAKKRT